MSVESCADLTVKLKEAKHSRTVQPQSLHFATRINITRRSKYLFARVIHIETLVLAATLVLG